jgi:hypothetical protein
MRRDTGGLCPDLRMTLTKRAWVPGAGPTLKRRFRQTFSAMRFPASGSVMVACGEHLLG